eukprot:TRINITY_DN3307_c1_g4_i1.p1 TRINITY_DN3307_c1_g4~~TRINITY_DN3307_c1_g4_i1.p1  ORF type:complete len:1528 (+),score=417.85 TRINITY_DN3307_c1_g4_i1:689-4585(+)
MCCCYYCAECRKPSEAKLAANKKKLDGYSAGSFLGKVIRTVFFGAALLFLFFMFKGNNVVAGGYYEMIYSKGPSNLLTGVTAQVGSMTDYIGDIVDHTGGIVNVTLMLSGLENDTFWSYFNQIFEFVDLLPSGATIKNVSDPIVNMINILPTNDSLKVFYDFIDHVNTTFKLDEVKANVTILKGVATSLPNLTDVSVNLTKIEEQKSKFGGISYLLGNVSSISTDISGLPSLTNMKANISTLFEGLTAVNGVAKDLTVDAPKMQDQDAEMTKIKTMVGSTNQNRVKAIDDVFAANYATLQSEVDASNYANVKTLCTNLNSMEVDSLKTDVDNVIGVQNSGFFQSLSSNTSKLSTGITKMKDNLNVVIGNVSALDVVINKTKNYMPTATSTLNDVKVAISTLDGLSYLVDAFNTTIQQVKKVNFTDDLIAVLAAFESFSIPTAEFNAQFEYFDDLMAKAAKVPEMVTNFTNLINPIVSKLDDVMFAVGNITQVIIYSVRNSLLLYPGALPASVDDALKMLDQVKEMDLGNMINSVTNMTSSMNITAILSSVNLTAIKTQVNSFNFSFNATEIKSPLESLKTYRATILGYESILNNIKSLSDTIKTINVQTFIDQISTMNTTLAALPNLYDVSYQLTAAKSKLDSLPSGVNDLSSIKTGIDSFIAIDFTNDVKPALTAVSGSGISSCPTNMAACLADSSTCDTNKANIKAELNALNTGLSSASSGYSSPYSQMQSSNTALSGVANDMFYNLGTGLNNLYTSTGSLSQPTGIPDSFPSIAISGDMGSIDVSGLDTISSVKAQLATVAALDLPGKTSLFDTVISSLDSSLLTSVKAQLTAASTMITTLSTTVDPIKGKISQLDQFVGIIDQVDEYSTKYKQYVPANASQFSKLFLDIVTNVTKVVSSIDDSTDLLISDFDTKLNPGRAIAYDAVLSVDYYRWLVMLVPLLLIVVPIVLKILFTWCGCGCCGCGPCCHCWNDGWLTFWMLFLMIIFGSVATAFVSVAFGGQMVCTVLQEPEIAQKFTTSLPANMTTQNFTVDYSTFGGIKKNITIPLVDAGIAVLYDDATSRTSVLDSIPFNYSFEILEKFANDTLKNYIPFPNGTFTGTENSNEMIKLIRYLNPKVINKTWDTVYFVTRNSTTTLKSILTWVLGPSIQPIIEEMVITPFCGGIFGGLAIYGTFAYLISWSLLLGLCSTCCCHAHWETVDAEFEDPSDKTFINNQPTQQIRVQSQNEFYDQKLLVGPHDSGNFGYNDSQYYGQLQNVQTIPVINDPFNGPFNGPIVNNAIEIPTTGGKTDSYM